MCERSVSLVKKENKSTLFIAEKETILILKMNALAQIREGSLPAGEALPAPCFTKDHTKLPIAAVLAVPKIKKEPY